MEQLLKTGIAARTGTNTGTAVYRGESLIASTQMDHLSKQPEFVNRVRENGQCLSLIIDVDDRTLAEHWLRPAAEWWNIISYRL